MTKTDVFPKNDVRKVGDVLSPEVVAVLTGEAQEEKPPVQKQENPAVPAVLNCRNKLDEVKRVFDEYLGKANLEVTTIIGNDVSNLAGHKQSSHLLLAAMVVGYTSPSTPQKIQSQNRLPIGFYRKKTPVYR